MHVMLFVSAIFLANSPADVPPSDSKKMFERDVRPILKAHCFHCHGEQGQKDGGLDLRLQKLMVQGGESGPAIVPGNVKESYLLDRIRSGEMPPEEVKKRLTKAEIAVISQWVQQGAAVAEPEPDSINSGFLFTQEERNFWAFQPVQKPAVPTPKETSSVHKPVDAFLLARLREQQMDFNPLADKRVLARRACFDLTGLPPTPEQVEAFVNNDAPNAFEEFVDRLLESPQYGERWARHWLDVAGYADSEGYSEDDTERPHAYRYRDYVVASFNKNKPIDQFIREQLAGDEMIPMPKKDLTEDDIEKLVATGFLRMAPDGTASAGIDPPVARNQVIADTMQIVSSSLLGLTVACAQCHDHRYDPIPQADYFRMRAIFDPAFDWQKWRVPNARRVSLYTDADRQTAAEIEKQVAEITKERAAKQDQYIEQTFEKQLAMLPEEVREPIRAARATAEKERTAEQQKLLRDNPSVNVTAGSLYLYDRNAADDLKSYNDKITQTRAQKPVEGFVRALTEVPGRIPVSHLMHRGDHEQLKEAVPPGDLSVLGDKGVGEIPGDDPALATSGRRLRFAQGLTDGKHPLTARVFVNRVWMHHFGKGIVETVGDFGLLGNRPTHPELLDWLAAEFVEHGWDLKWLHRELMNTHAYQQSSIRDPQKDAKDPGNQWYGRMQIRRLEAEVLRDSILAVSGKLVQKQQGPPVPVMADEVGQFVVGIENLDAGRPGAVIPLNGEEYRRSLYVQVRRSRPLGVLDSFDAPRMEPNCEARSASTVAPQSLMLMNSDFAFEQSRHFAKRVIQEAGADPDSRVTHAWQLAFGNVPGAEDLAAARAFVADQQKHFEANPMPTPDKKKKPAATDIVLTPEEEALASLCHALIGSNGFLYVD